MTKISQKITEAKMKKIHAFAEKWLKILLPNNRESVRLTEKHLGEECEKLGFLMDCGHRADEVYPGLMRQHSELIPLYNTITDIPVLGSAIYSQWRYYQHWAFSPWDIPWFILAFQKLHELTAPEYQPPKQEYKVVKSNNPKDWHEIHKNCLIELDPNRVLWVSEGKRVYLAADIYYPLTERDKDKYVILKDHAETGHEKEIIRQALALPLEDDINMWWKLYTEKEYEVERKKDEKTLHDRILFIETADKCVWHIDDYEKLKKGLLPPSEITDHLRKRLRNHEPQNCLEGVLCGSYFAGKMEKELKDGFEVNQRDIYGRTPLMYCSQTYFGHVEKFVNAGADCTVTDYDGNTILMYLCNDCTDWRAVDLILKNGCDINAKNRFDHTVADYAVMQGLDFSPLLERGANEPEFKEKDVLFLLAKSGLESDGLFTYLLKDGRIKRPDMIQQFAVTYPKQLVNFLVQCQKHEFTPEPIFIQRENAEVLNQVFTDMVHYIHTPYMGFLSKCFMPRIYLKENGSAYRDLLDRAIIGHEHQVLEQVLECWKEPDADIVRSGEKFLDTDGRENLSPLMFAVQENDAESVRILLAHGANPTTGCTIFEEKETAVSCAIRNNNLSILTMLAETGADMNFAVPGGYTPLMSAIKYKRFSMFDLLLEHGADTMQKDKNGRTLKDYLDKDFPPELRKKLTADQEKYEFVKQIKVAGTFAIENKEKLLNDLHLGDEVALIPEPQNKYDSNAIRIEYHWSKLGYVPKDDAKELSDEMRKDRCFFGKIVEIDKKKTAVFVEIYRHKLLPLDSISGFTYISGGGYHLWPPRSRRYTFSLSQKKIVYEEISYMTEVRRMEITFAENEWPCIMNRLQKCNFLVWEKDYSELVCDGGYWEVSIRMKHGKNRVSRGTVRFPEEWNIFERFIQYCLDMTHIKGNGSCSIIPWNEYSQRGKKISVRKRCKTLKEPPIPYLKNKGKS